MNKMRALPELKADLNDLEKLCGLIREDIHDRINKLPTNDRTERYAEELDVIVLRANLVLSEYFKMDLPQG